LPGKPDIVFRRARVAVFVDGDFWHGRDWKRRKRRLELGANSAYWVKKISSNRARDRRHSGALRRLGWRVVRFWESEMKSAPEHHAEFIIDLVTKGKEQAAARVHYGE